MRSPSLLVLLVVMIILTFRIELKTQLSNEVEATATIFYTFPDLQDSPKEKIILSQEKSIQRLNELVLALQKQLEICRAKGGNVMNDTMMLSEFLNEIELQ